jgi:predicted RNase H-like HicB family nuclease
MRYAVDLERDDAGWWIVSARGVSGCHTQGRSIRQALSRMREALSVCVDESIASDQLDPCVHLPAEARQVVARYESASKRLERDQRAAHSATDRAIEILVGGLSFSVRDAGDVLGLSHQRVHQLVSAQPR